MDLKKLALVVLPVLVSIALATGGLLLFKNFREVAPVWNPFPFNLIFTDKCANVFLKDWNFFDRECLKQTLAKAVGYAIVILSGALKLPMIFNVWQAQSTVGLNIHSVAMESISQSLSTAASMKKMLPFGLWGEHGVIYLQNLALIYLATYFSPMPKNKKDLFLLAGIVAFTVIVIVAFPVNTADGLLATSTLLSMSSRLPQLYDNYTLKHTGVLSTITQTLQFVGSVVRMGTVFDGTDDFGTRLGSVIAVVLSACVLGQVVVYREETQKHLASLLKEKKGEEREKKKDK